MKKRYILVLHGEVYRFRLDDVEAALTADDHAFAQRIDELID